MLKGKYLVTVLVLGLVGLMCENATAQESLPRDNGIVTYHTAPRYRESESHPLRVAAYILHPVGWVLREAIFRPLSYFASSSEVTRSVMGYREPYDYRQPDCFSADDGTPDCHSMPPFNYEGAGTTEPEESALVQAERQVYFPNVNFDFNSRKLNALGKGRVKQISELLKASGDMKIVLQGHTDYMGSDAYNQKLGMDRAEAVRQELVSLGVPAERLATVSFGMSKPIYTEKEDWARAINRRVEVQVDEAVKQ